MVCVCFGVPIMYNNIPLNELGGLMPSGHVSGVPIAGCPQL